MAQNSDLIIEDYQAIDRTACIDIFKSNFPLYFAPEELPLLENWLNSKDKNEIAYKNNKAEYFYVVKQNNKLVACGGFYINNKKQACMAWGMVTNEFHKKGIGMALLTFRINQIHKNYPHYSILLDTSQHTFKFFEKMGFVVTNITQNAYGKGLHKYDMIMK
jgi:N-acetylglutamate synthase-like GNAT family acetyltransferase